MLNGDEDRYVPSIYGKARVHACNREQAGSAVLPDANALTGRHGSASRHP